MSLKDSANYILFNNPISSSIISGLCGIRKTSPVGSQAIEKSAKSVQSTVTMTVAPLWKLAGHNLWFVRCAGLSGASAVVLGAYGAHTPFPSCTDADLKKVFETANRFHFFHSLALLGVPLARRPLLSGTLLVTGMTLFCFPCYYRAFTGKAKYNKAAPIGGVCLILAWLSFLL